MNYLTMRNQIKNSRRSKGGANLSHTAQTIVNQQSDKNSIDRYRKISLPTSVGHNYSISIRNRLEEPTTEMYFNPHKKSKFIKDIVDNYFEQTLQKIHIERESQGKQMENIQKNLKNNITRRSKIFFSASHPQSQMQISAKKEQSRNRNDNIYEIVDQQTGDFYQTVNSSGNTSNANSNPNISSFLPPIYQSYEDIEDIAKSIPELSNISQEIILKSQSSQKIMTFENEAFRIYLITENKVPKLRMKQYKNTGMEILRRELRAQKFGVEGLWKQSQINTYSFISPIVQPLKSMICKMIPHHDGKVKYKVRTTNFRKYLLSNGCLELRHLIRQICSVLKKVQGRVLNNKINPSNIFVLKGNKICIGQWGCSSFRDQYQIQKNKFQSRINPILKSTKEWLATPEYFSPQILFALMSKSDQQQPDIWQYTSGCDIWSLGITLFQILTMIPIWMNEVCSTKSKTKKPTVRAGLLGVDDRKLNKIIEKQKKLQKMVTNCIQNEIEEDLDKQIIDLIGRMITHDPTKRITLDQIISIIK